MPLNGTKHFLQLLTCFPLLLVLFVFAAIGALKAQEEVKFSQNSELFINEISEKLQQTSNRNQLNQAKDLMNKLVPVWNQGRFNKAEKDGIKMLATLIFEQKLRPFPYLYDFMVLVNHFAKSRQLHRQHYILEQPCHCLAPGR